MNRMNRIFRKREIPVPVLAHGFLEVTNEGL